MSVLRYRYTHNGHAGTLVMGQGEDGSVYPLAPDDLIHLDTPGAASRTQADALVAAWQDLDPWAAGLPEPESARQTRRGCLDVMQRAALRQNRRWRLTSEHETAAINPARPDPRCTWRPKS